MFNFDEYRNPNVTFESIELRILYISNLQEVIYN